MSTDPLESVLKDAIIIQMARKKEAMKLLEIFNDKIVDMIHPFITETSNEGLKYALGKCYLDKYDEVAFAMCNLVLSPKIITYQDFECFICCGKKEEFCRLPCSHEICKSCACQMRNKQCPLCKRDFKIQKSIPFDVKINIFQNYIDNAEKYKDVQPFDIIMSLAANEDLHLVFAN
jgi:hypothetical protein